MSEKDRAFCELAIAEAQRSTQEDGRPHPKVGVVVVTSAREDAPTLAHRGKSGPGDHAEFCALEHDLRRKSVVGATVYTTLEPCTVRKPPKVPCADRLIERKVSRVLIGMLDPNPAIRGNGILALRRANIEVQMFPGDLAARVEELNREFIRAQQTVELKTVIPVPAREAAERIDPGEFLNKRLDEWYQIVYDIYGDRNYHRDAMSIFAHLVEVVGGLSGIASEKQKLGPAPTTFIPKAFAWWLALCGKLFVGSVEELIWTKFPGVCPYCQHPTCVPDDCSERKAKSKGPDWDSLERIGRGRSRPTTLGGWQQMFATIYPPHPTEDLRQAFGRLSEELGELAEALRVFPIEPGYFISEASDVFAWLMHIQNRIDRRNGVPRERRGESLNGEFARAYPGRCLDCNNSPCSCYAVLETTIGRIAHEVPRAKAGILFEPGRRPGKQA